MSSSFEMEHNNFDMDSPYLLELAKRFDLNSITQADLNRFDHFSSSHRHFLIVFINRWRNQALNKRTFQMQKAFNAVREQAKYFKYLQNKQAKVEVEEKALDALRLSSDGDARTEDQIKLIANWLGGVNINEEKTALSADQLKALAGGVRLMSAEDGEVLFLQGHKGLSYYILLSGIVCLHSSSSAASELRAKTLFKNHGPSMLRASSSEASASASASSLLGREITRISRKYDGFGELSLLSPMGEECRTLSAVCCGATETSADVGGGRSPTTHAKGVVTFLALDKDCFDLSLRERNAYRLDIVAKVSALKSLPIFSSWRKATLTPISYGMKMRTYKIHDKIEVMDSPVRNVHFVIEGTVKLQARIDIDKVRFSLRLWLKLRPRN